MQQLSVRDIEEKDINAIVQYWHQPNHQFLKNMGVDIAKIPSPQDLFNMLASQLTLPYDKKQSYCIIWQYNGVAIGHCNVNKIIFGTEAYLHLHLWQNNFRQKGMGFSFLKMAIPFFFHHLQLQHLYSEPCSLNTAPNKTLEKLGFTKLKTYTTIPGYLNFEQEVNLWQLSADDMPLLDKI